MRAALHFIPWQLPATLAAAAVLLFAMERMLRGVIPLVRRPRHTGGQRRASWPALRAVIITLAAMLAPVFFLDMFLTVTRLLGPSFHGWAWTVPAATEGSFTVLYLLDLYLQHLGKPMGWLRWAPYPFAAASLFLNVYASWGSLPAMTGHAVVTVAFFLPLLAAEAAVRSLSVSEETVALAAEMADARRYALDLVRDRKGVWWRLKVPSLLKRQILHSRPPAAVTTAVRDGLQFGGAAKWEPAVEEWVSSGLTQDVKMAVKVETKKREIERQAEPSPEPSPDAQPDRQPRTRKTVSEADRRKAKVTRILTDYPALSLTEVAAKAGVSESTVTRIKRDMPTRLRVAGE